MIHVVVGVFDSAARCFGRPVCSANEALARRAFEMECVRDSPDNAMFHHPEHFTLYVLGRFNDEDGSFESVRSMVCVASDFFPSRSYEVRKS